MKKLVLLIIVLLGCIHLQANPIIYRPALITELYFDANDNWTIEINFLETPTDLGYYHIKTSNGTSALKLGLTIPSNNILLITKDSLVTPLDLSRDGGTVCIEKWSNSNWYTCPPTLSYGNMSNPDVTKPRMGQSIQLASCKTTDGENYAYYKNNAPNLGAILDLTAEMNSRKSIIKGRIYNLNFEPVNGYGVSFKRFPSSCCFPPEIAVDNNGFFYAKLFARSYELKIYDTKTNLLKDTVFILELDSTINFNIYIDLLLSTEGASAKGKEIKMVNYPNPFSENTDISIDIPENYSFKIGIVKIFSAEGEIMLIKPLSSKNKNLEKYNLAIDKTSFNGKSGTYFCVLELDGQKVASCQMTVVK